MNRKHCLSLMLALAALAAVALLAAPRAALARHESSAAAEGGAHGSATTKPAGCETCKMAMMDLEMMAKLRTLLTEAKAAAGPKAKDAVEKIDEALKLLEECHQKMHEHMRHHMMTAHRSMMRKGKMPEMKCPMCGQPLAALPKVVNSVCPITGNKIDPYTVPDELTREFRGKKVGFCSSSCLPAWDKLSSRQKQQKLDAAMKASEKPAELAGGEEHSGH
jgi:hypothetical protein